MDECFFLASRISKRHLDRLDISDTESRERYLAYLPLLAMDLKGQIVNIANLSTQASDRQMDEIYEGIERVIREMKKKGEEDGEEG